MRYVVVGAGAIGGTLAAQLAGAGRQVAVVARGATYEAIAAVGLRFVTSDGEVVRSVPVVRDPATLDLGEDDLVVLAMKTQDTASALDALAGAAPPSVPILCAQNGIENERLALRLFEHVYGARVNVPAARLEPGVVRAYAAPVLGIVDVGAFPRGADDRARRIAADLTDAGFSSHAVADVARWKRHKLLVNLGNAVDAACGRAEDAADLVDLAVAEGRACLAAAGLDVATPAEDAARRVVMTSQRAAGLDEFPGSSAWQSLQRGERTEVDHLNGEIVLLGRLHGVPTPVNEVLQATVRRLTRDGAAPGSVAPADLRREVERRTATRAAVTGSAGKPRSHWQGRRVGGT